MLKRILLLLVIAGTMNSAVGMGYLFETAAGRSPSDQPSGHAAGIEGESSTWYTAKSYLDLASRLPLEWPSVKTEQNKLQAQTTTFAIQIRDLARQYNTSLDKYKQIIKDAANSQIRFKSEQEKEVLQKQQAVLDKALAEVEQRARL